MKFKQLGLPLNVTRKWEVSNTVGSVMEEIALLVLKIVARNMDCDKDCRLSMIVFMHLYGDNGKCRKFD